MIFPNLRKLLSGNPLKPVSFGGLFLALVVSWALVFFSLTLEPYTIPETTGGETPFAGELRELDGLLSSSIPGDPAAIEKALRRLEKKARSQEERLSALKRRRNLARQDSRFVESYTKAATDAAGDFAYSEAMAAVAAEALFLNGRFSVIESVIEKEDSSALETYTARMRGNFFLPLLISVHVLKGDLRTPHRASDLPGLEKILASGLPQLSQVPAESLVLNEALLRALKDDVPAAAVRMNNLLASRGDEERVLRAAAGFFYDHGNFLRAAELFARLPAGEGAGREADALALAGETGRARELWRLLASPQVDGRSGDSGGLIRSLYNLAAVSAGAADPAEEKAWLEKLFAALNADPAGPGAAGISTGTPAAVFGLIRYTRLLDTPRSIVILAEEGLRKNPFLDLELLRRRIDTWPAGKSLTEAWLLLERRPEEERLYQWAAYFFDRQKQYAETERLLKNAANRHISGPWLDLHRALALIREGKVSGGEKILKDALAERKLLGGAAWLYHANLGRVSEGRRSFQAALDSYRTAAALVTDKADAARLQLRISRCLKALGRDAESRRALENALELDPDNLDARYELRRLDG
jgi:tetratricopeptide (TPR) repeat protein